MPRNRSLPAGTALTVKLLSAYLAKNEVAPQSIPDLIHAARKALVAPGGGVRPEPVGTVDHAPAVSVRESLRSAEYILSMIDGKPYRTLRRHLAAHGLTPDEYRARYGLAADYPLVAPGYAAQRSTLARQSGLGRKDRVTEPEIEEVQVTPEPVAAEPPAIPEPSPPQPVDQEEPPAPAPTMEAEPAPEAPDEDSPTGARPRLKLSLFSRLGDKADAQPDAASAEPAGADEGPTRTEPVAPSGDQDAASDRASPRLAVMEAITRLRAVSALYNGAVVKLAPHQIFERRGDLFLAALNLGKNWRSEEEKRLGQFKFAGLSDVKLLPDGVTPLPSYDGVPPRPEDVLILSI